MVQIKITHSRAEGTLLDGSRKGDGVFEIVRPHGFWFFRSLGMLGIRNSRDKEAQTWQINGAAEALRAAGHEVTVTIDEDTRRTFEEAEADRLARAEDRAERYSERAGRAAASSEARRATADGIAKRFEFGQPILVGHHSERRARRDAERIDTNMRKSFEEQDRAKHWAHRAQSAVNYEEYRNDPQRTRRRVERLRADLRQQERYHAEAVEKGWDAGRHARLAADLREEIAYWEQLIEKAKADGVKLWGPDDFAPGDFVMYLGTWYEVKRVNPKTLSIAWNLRLTKRVMTLEDATDCGRTWTHSADYTQAQGRCPGEAMRAFLADGKVPGLKSAREASEAAPASAVREAQAAKPKPKRRSDPKTPKRVKVECQWDAPEATLTWLDGRSRPHKDWPAVKLAAPDGVKFTESVWSRPLLAEVTKYLAGQGFTYRGSDWSGSPGRGIVRAVEPAPVTEAEPLVAEEKGDRPAGPAGPQEATGTAEAPRPTSGGAPSSMGPDLQKPSESSLAKLVYPSSFVYDVESNNNPPSPAPKGANVTATVTRATKTAKDSAKTAEPTEPAPAKTPAKKATAKAPAKTPAKKAAKPAAKKAAPTPVARKTAQRTIPTDRIDRDPGQPREHFDPVKLQELANSMKKLGQLQPVTVRYVPETRRYTLIMGERRWRAARMAGITEMLALVEHGLAEGDRETFAKSVAENVGRADMTPMEEAKAFQRLVDAEYSVDEVAEMCGKSPAYVGWRIDLLKLCGLAQEALTKGHLPVGLSWYVASLSQANQNRFLVKWSRGDFPSTRDAEAFAQAARAEEKRQEQQGSFFVLADETTARKDTGQDAIPGSLDLPEEERERIITDRKRLTRKIDRLGDAGAILSELATADPEELALLLAGTPGGVAGHRQRIEHLRDVAVKAMKNLRDAQALAAVRAGSLEINQQATAAQ